MARYLWTLTSVWSSIAGLILVIKSIIEYELMGKMMYSFEVQCKNHSLNFCFSRLSGIGKNDTSRLNSDWNFLCSRLGK